MNCGRAVIGLAQNYVSADQVSHRYLIFYLLVLMMWSQSPQLQQYTSAGDLTSQYCEMQEPSFH